MRHQTIYFIMVRPPGSLVWTHWTFQGTSTPYRTSVATRANREAEFAMTSRRYCAIVTPVQVPGDPDGELYALHADGDTKFTATP